MLDNIAPGSRVNVKVVKRPTNAAAQKTLVRLLSKDAKARAENRRLARARQSGFRQKQRGGRFWDINVVKQQPVQARQGEAGTITATLDVLKDLRSVSRFVEVTPA